MHVIEVTHARYGDIGMQDWPLNPNNIAYELDVDVEAIDAMIQTSTQDGRLCSIQIIMNPGKTVMSGG